MADLLLLLGRIIAVVAFAWCLAKCAETAIRELMRK